MKLDIHSVSRDECKYVIFSHLTYRRWHKHQLTKWSCVGKAEESLPRESIHCFYIDTRGGRTMKKEWTSIRYSLSMLETGKCVNDANSVRESQDESLGRKTRNIENLESSRKEISESEIQDKLSSKEFMMDAARKFDRSFQTVENRKKKMKDNSNRLRKKRYGNTNYNKITYVFKVVHEYAYDIQFVTSVLDVLAWNPYHEHVILTKVSLSFFKFFLKIVILLLE